MLRSLAEICGLDRGFCRGRGGSMHLQWKEAGAIGTNAIVGGGVPLAAGLRVGAPARGRTPSRSPTSATARSTSAPRSKR